MGTDTQPHALDMGGRGAPAVTYGSLVWGTNLTDKQKDKLNKLQRLALTQVANIRYSTPELD